MAADVWGGEERALLGRASWSEAKQRSPQGEGCRWMLMPGGGGRV